MSEWNGKEEGRRNPGRYHSQGSVYAPEAWVWTVGRGKEAREGRAQLVAPASCQLPLGVTGLRLLFALYIQ